MDSLKKGEIVGEGTKLDLPTYDLDLLKKGEAVGDSTKLVLPTYDLNSLKKDEAVSEDKDSNLPGFHINVSKKNSESLIEKSPVQNDNSVTKLDSLKDKQITKSTKLDAKMKNQPVASNSKKNASLPQTGSKNDSTILIFAGISSLFTALGLSIFKKKTK